ncbi:MAG: HD domain-containing protein [Rikenellaceae bacterium]|nr:HD domain-containing protein [Rikenellaceae bacterium]
MRPSLKQYIEQEILPRYDHFDSAHRRDHAEQVMRESLRLATLHGAREELAYTIAAYHDTGLVAGRELHHIHSGEIIRADQRLREWFTEEEIALMAEAAEDHRASSDHAPRTIYGQIVAEADRTIEPLMILRRTVQYGLTHYPSLTREEHYNRFLGHLLEKYAEGGYLRLWIVDPEKEQRLGELRALIRDREQLRTTFEQLFQQETER